MLFKEEIDEPLSYADNEFDLSICHITIQMVMYPEVLLKEMKRISKFQIISFPNFAFYKNRMDLLFNGRMPKPMLFGYKWFSTGHIHQFSLKDFEYLVGNIGGLKITSKNFISSKNVLKIFCSKSSKFIYAISYLFSKENGISMSIIDKVISHPLLKEFPPVLIDIGASGQIHKKWKKIASHSICIAFDADDREFGYVVKENSGYKKLYVYNCIVSNSNKSKDNFYLTKSPYCSSLLEPDEEALKNYAFAEKFKVEKKENIETEKINRCFERT